MAPAHLVPADTADSVVLNRYGFKPGELYMRVPRCGACRWWTHQQIETEALRTPIGECMFGKRGGADFYSRTPIITLSDFGCIQHEQRGDGPTQA